MTIKMLYNIFQINEVCQHPYLKGRYRITSLYISVESLINCYEQIHKVLGWLSTNILLYFYRRSSLLYHWVVNLTTI